MSVDEIHRPINRVDSPAVATIALPAAAPGVSLWWSDLAHAADDVARVAPWLSAEEHARAARFGTDALRLRYIAGRATLRLLLARTLGIEPGAVALRHGDRGRPALALPMPGPDFNVSHTRGGAIFGIATGLPAPARIGVDIEHEDRALAADGLARKFLSADEQATLQDIDPDARRRRFLRYWTCKEAMSKATGDGLSAPFSRLSVTIGPAPQLAAGPAPYEPHAWRLHDIAVPGGFIATLAIWDGAHALTSEPRP